MQGSPADLARSGVDFAELVGTHEKVNEDNPEGIERQMSRQYSTRSVSSISSNGSTDGTELDADEDYELKGIEMEASSKGKVKGSVFANYFRAGAHWSILIVLVISFIMVQFLASSSDYWVSIW